MPGRHRTGCASRCLCGAPARLTEKRQGRPPGQSPEACCGGRDGICAGPGRAQCQTLPSCPAHRSPAPSFASDDPHHRGRGGMAGAAAGGGGNESVNAKLTRAANPLSPNAPDHVPQRAAFPSPSPDPPGPGHRACRTAAAKGNGSFRPRLTRVTRGPSGDCPGTAPGPVRRYQPVGVQISTSVPSGART